MASSALYIADWVLVSSRMATTSSRLNGPSHSSANCYQHVVLHRVFVAFPLRPVRPGIGTEACGDGDQQEGFPGLGILARTCGVGTRISCDVLSLNISLGSIRQAVELLAAKRNSHPHLEPCSLQLCGRSSTGAFAAHWHATGRHWQTLASPSNGRAAGNCLQLGFIPFFHAAALNCPPPGYGPAMA